MDILCRFARRFPVLAAEILHRDRHKRRNFREETITDILMAGLVPFEPFGVSTDYPIDESKTGEDMDWEFVDEHAVDGRRYLRLHIQAKRAIQSKTKTPYWFYRELDHAVSPKPPIGPVARYGTQHKLLIDEAAKITGCVPIYMFYHPSTALDPASTDAPEIEGVNWMFADVIPVNVTSGHWPVADKKVEKWRSQFHRLTDLLCFGKGYPSFVVGRDGLPQFIFAEQPMTPTPGEVADRLNQLGSEEAANPRRIAAVTDIPQTTLAAIAAGREGRRVDVERPRIIFNATRGTEGQELL